jgi:spermidine synthase
MRDCRAGKDGGSRRHTLETVSDRLRVASAPLFGVALAVSAALFFLLQPMVAKMLLPALGGVPAVWTTCMLCFQGILLAGYAFAYLSSSYLAVEQQRAIHLVVLFLAAAMLPIDVGQRDLQQIPRTESPVGWLLRTLLTSTGPPLLIVAATSPVLQNWYAQSGNTRADDPYFLYAASNIGSLVGLIGYPFLVEPNLSLSQQSRLWTLGYGLLAFLTLGCAAISARGTVARGRIPGPPGTDDLSSTERGIRLGDSVTISRRALWVARAFVPSSLMLGVTTYLTTDVAAVPVLWMVPLSLYLLTFVLAFARRSVPATRIVGRALSLVTVPLLIAIVTEATHPAWLLIPLHLLMFVLAATSCHFELARDRPTRVHLTEYYLWISLGGVLGGVCNALVAPLIFRGVTEYPLAIVLACLLRRATIGKEETARERWLDAGLCVCLATLVIASGMAVQGLELAQGRVRTLLVYLAPALLCYRFVQRPSRFAVGLVGILLGSFLVPGAQGELLRAQRNFFGVLRVTLDSDGGFHQLVHGSTIHGRQSLDPVDHTEPMSYYHRNGPLGQLFAAFTASATAPRVAVVGLGAGIMAAYAAPNQEWTFYEINPSVAELASDPRLFTFLRDCRAREKPRIVLGDARLRLREAPSSHYGLIVLDAFNSDAIPVHLLTREALAQYTQSLAERGLLAFHVSSRLLDLRPILADLARDAGLAAYVRDDVDAPLESMERGQDPSRWVVMARSEADLSLLRFDHRWERLSGEGRSRVWTDDFSDVMAAMRLSVGRLIM